jgi:hypothetical protein
MLDSAIRRRLLSRLIFSALVVAVPSHDRFWLFLTTTITTEALKRLYSCTKLDHTGLGYEVTRSCLGDPRISAMRFDWTAF